jgi:DNA-binding CsgD family transcriptional regulator
MARSRLLRLRDVRSATRLVAECRDLAYDPDGWRGRAFEGLQQIFGARLVAGGELRWQRPAGPIEPMHPMQCGFTPSDVERYFLPYLREHGPDGDVLFGRLKTIAGRHVTRTRKQLLTDSIWYRSSTYADFYRVNGMDHCVGSLYEFGPAQVSQIGLHRVAGDPAFSERERRLLHFFHAELGRLIGPVLVPADDIFSPTRLPDRVRETLQYLLEGDSEKQVAARMSLSRVTVHQYVTALYRHYRVTSRAELLACVLRRPGGRRDG